MNVTDSTRVCSAHFGHGCTVPYVKSPSLKKPEQPARRVLIRKSVKDRSEYYKPVPSLSELCKKHVGAILAKSVQLEHTEVSLREKLILQESVCSKLMTESHQTVNSLTERVVMLQAEKLHLQSQHEASVSKIESLQAQLSNLSLKNECLQKTVHTYEENRYRLRAEYLKGRDKDIQFYTGFTTWSLFILFFQSLQVYDLHNLQYIGRGRTFPEGKKRGPPRALDPLNEFFLTLVRLKLGLLERDLADRFGISQGLVSIIFNTWLNLIYHHLSSLKFWPTRETVQKYMPKEFAKSERYGYTRIILDATELFIEKPSDLSLQSVTWSNYKSHNTLKGLIGICPFGGVTFVSCLWAGSISDIELTTKCGLLDLLQAGDNVMADKGFKIEDVLKEHGITLNIPPFMSDGKLSKQDVKLTREVATLRIHVERAIERVKNFRILDGNIPNSIPAPTVNKMFYVCAMLTNMQGYLLKPDTSAQSVSLSSSADCNPLRDISNTSSLPEKTPVTPVEVKKKLAVTPELQKLVEQKTKQQNKCPLWYQLRSYRLTSSFGRIAKRKNKFESLATQLTHEKQFSHTSVPSLRWGVEHEDEARCQYEQELHKSHPTLKVVCSGLWIDIERSWLASSPDGLVYDQDELLGVLEIKCPFSAREMTPIEAAQKLPSFPCQVIGGNLSLKRNHDYFFQVQGQLAITHAQWCDFCVYTPHGFSLERIMFDESFWKSVVCKLDDFYCKFIVPAISNDTIPCTEELVNEF